jgi:hypothetical protein
MQTTLNGFLIAGAIASGVAAILHVGCIVYGAPWYRFFGAGEKMAGLSEKGSLVPTMVTSCIVAVLSGWAIYAFSGAGVIAPLPLLRETLIAITSIYLIRAVAGIPLAFIDRERSKIFWLWSSIICLVIGLVYLIGLQLM